MQGLPPPAGNGRIRPDFSETKIRIIRPERHRWPDLEPQDDINPSDPAPIFCPVDGGVEMITARWSFVPAKHKGSFAEWRKKLSTSGRAAAWAAS